jgi:predicted glycoside hydrolase/deacetylase ChbG (UPF0249 family)
VIAVPNSFTAAKTKSDLMKALLVNADDLGISEAVNSAIIKAYEEGIVRSASLIYNPCSIKSVAVMANKYPNLTIGYHANLTFGQPVLPGDHVKSLINSKNIFYSKWEFVYRYFLSKINDNLVKSREEIVQNGITILESVA